MDWKWQIVAALAMVMIEASYVPQIVRLYRTKKAKDLSTFFPLMNAGGRILGLTYTGFTGEIVLALGFLAGILLRVTLLFQVWYYKRMESLEEPKDSSEARWFGWSASPAATGSPQEEKASSLPVLMTTRPGREFLLQPVLCHADTCQLAHRVSKSSS